jgi:hypothetical protein
MATIIQRIESVNPRSVNTRRGPGTVYDVMLGDGTKASTFDSTIGNKATSMVGQMAAVDLTSKTNDRGYTDVYLNSINAADGDATPTTNEHAPAESKDDTAARIARTSALRFGIDVGIAAGTPGQVLWSAVEEYADWILHGKQPGDATGANPDEDTPF